jgi:hypothetical protein
MTERLGLVKEHRLKQGNKPIFHLEAFVAKVRASFAF